MEAEEGKWHCHFFSFFKIPARNPGLESQAVWAVCISRLKCSNTPITMSAEGCRSEVGQTENCKYKQIYQLQNLKTQQNVFRSQGTGVPVMRTKREKKEKRQKRLKKRRSEIVISAYPHSCLFWHRCMLLERAREVRAPCPLPTRVIVSETTAVCHLQDSHQLIYQYIEIVNLAHS